MYFSFIAKEGGSICGLVSVVCHCEHIEGMTQLLAIYPADYTLPLFSIVTQSNYGNSSKILGVILWRLSHTPLQLSFR